MKKNVIYFLLLAVLILSCSRDEPVPDNNPEINYYFTLSKTELNVSSEENEFNVGVSTNSNWEVESKPEWVKVEPENGNQDEKLSITFLENTNPTSRNSFIKFRSTGKTYSLKVTQESFPIRLVSFSGSESSIKINQPKYLLFNKPITLNYISSGDIRYSFFAGPNDVEYFNNNHGVKFNVGPSKLGSEHQYKFSVTDGDRKLEEVVDLKFYSQKIIIPGAIQKMVLDDENNLWVLSVKEWEAAEPSYMIKYVENKGEFEEILRFQVDIDLSNSDYLGGDFFINPYNDLIYIPDYEGEEIDVYSKTGSLIKHIQIPPVESDHPEYPHSSPVFIGFNLEGKGIVSLQGKGISRIRWRFIDSANEDALTQPADSHPYFDTDFMSFVLNRDKSKLYTLEERSPIIKVFDGTETFGEINMRSLYPNGADASRVVQNRLVDKIYVSGLYNSQIISNDLSFTSNQSIEGFLGDFCYDPERPNCIYAFDSNSNFKLLDYDNKKTLLDLPLDKRFNWTNNRGLSTTPDDRFIITFSDNVDPTTSRSQIVIYSTEMFK